MIDEIRPHHGSETVNALGIGPTQKEIPADILDAGKGHDPGFGEIHLGGVIHIRTAADFAPGELPETLVPDPHMGLVDLKGAGTTRAIIVDLIDLARLRGEHPDFNQIARRPIAVVDALDFAGNFERGAVVVVANDVGVGVLPVIPG